jgi:hypothetical protein
MRALIPLAALAALAFAQSAAAATVTIAPVGLSPEFQTTLQDDLGEREGAYLQANVAEAVGNALTRRGAEIGTGGDYTLEITIVDARPNRPTMQQLRDEPGLDWSRSFSTGGAELRGVLRGAGGQVVVEVQHDYFTPSLEHVFAPAGSWSDAHRAIRAFANKVADAYAANAR